MYKNTRILLVFICFVVFLTSCRSTRQETQKTETYSEKTSEKVVSYKDTTLFAPKAETSIKIPISDLTFKGQLNGVSKPLVYSQKNAQAQVKLRIVHDTIYAVATCDSLALVAKIRNELQKEHSANSTKIESESKDKTGFSFFQIGLAFLFGLFCRSIIGFLIKIFKIV